MSSYLLRKVTVLQLGIYQVCSCPVQWLRISLSLFHYYERNENIINTIWTSFLFCAECINKVSNYFEKRQKFHHSTRIETHFIHIITSGNNGSLQQELHDHIRRIQKHIPHLGVGRIPIPSIAISLIEP